MKPEIKGNEVIFNLSTGKENFSQRNNVIDPHNTCGPTNMVQSLEYLGYTFPSTFPNLKQPEDKLTNFCLTDKRVLEYYKKVDEKKYNDWATKTGGYYNPFEIHAVLSYATNLFMEKDVTYFSDKCEIRNILSDIIINNSPIVTSGKFSGLGHVVTIVGFIFDKDEYNKNKSDKEWFVKIKPTKVILDDTYGKTYDYKSGKSGNDSEITWDNFVSDINIRGSSEFKWAHRFFYK